MCIRISTFIAMWSVVMFSTNAIAKDIAVYRWVDENNVVHFSQHQPQDSNYSQLTTFSSYKAKKLSKSKVKPSLDEQIEQSKNEHAEIAEKNKVIREKNCTAAQLNRKTLNSFSNVSMVGSDGNSRLLTDEEKAAQLKLSNNHVDLYCDKKQG